MKLAAKTFLIITIAVTLGLGTIFGIAGILLLEDFRDIEAREAEAELDRIEGFVQDDLQVMEGSARGLSDLAGALFGGADQPASNDTTELFLNLFFVQRIDHLFAYTPSPNGTQVFGFSFDRTTFNITGPPEALNATLLQLRFGLDLPVGDTASGLIRAGDTSYLVASAPLILDALDSFNETTTLTIAREIGPAFNLKLAETARETTQLAPPDPSIGALSIERVDRDHLVAQRTLVGIDGQPAAALFLDSDRATFQSGVTSILVFMAAGAGIAVVFLIAGLMTMQVLVTGRVQNLGREMRTIRASDRLDGRVEMKGNDEVHDLARDFNHLMDALEAHEQELQQTNRDLEGFASIASHDLKSPLSSFSLNLALERRAAQARSDEDALNRIHRMERGVATMRDRIDAILAYSRSKDVEMHVRQVDLGTVLDQVLEDLHADIERTSAQIQRGKMPVAMGDAEQLLQVLQNLISNAIKYAKPDTAPQIRIRAETRPGAVRIHVEDQGRGFHPDDVDAMLEPFRRLSNTAGASGHGVGLATVVRILERLQGSLDVHGQPDVGARFTFTLPAPASTPAVK